MTETIRREYAPLPIKIRTARKRHHCDDCEKPIDPGQNYGLSASPPHRIDVYDVDRWVIWRTHYPRHDGHEFLPGCTQAAIERERLEIAQDRLELGL